MTAMTADRASEHTRKIMRQLGGYGALTYHQWGEIEHIIRTGIAAVIQ
jgi:hypothetical protein